MKILNRYANVASIAHLIALMTFKLSTMIDARELRIGNWVNTPREDQNPFRVDEVELMDKSFGKVGMSIIEGGHPLTWYLENIEPIPLTPKVIEKCGFVKNSRRETHTIQLQADEDKWNCLFIGKEPDFWWWGMQDYTLDSIRGFKIYHLHQLQNLYFALTGTELNYQP